MLSRRRTMVGTKATVARCRVSFVQDLTVGRSAPRCWWTLSRAISFRDQTGGVPAPDLAPGAAATEWSVVPLNPSQLATVEEENAQIQA